MSKGFDRYASLYDAWFIENRNVLYSEVNLVAKTLQDAGRILSVGCGSGLFEHIMRTERGIDVRHGIEPSQAMADIARKRGMQVQVCTAEDYEFEKDAFDTVLFNGTPSYIAGLAPVVKRVYDALPAGGRIILVDVPKESSYGLLYNLAMTLSTWDHPLLQGCHPKNPYPIQLVKAANWRTTAEKIKMLEDAGFKDLQFAQTLTANALYSDNAEEQPIDGYDKGDYVAITAFKH